MGKRNKGTTRSVRRARQGKPEADRQRDKQRMLEVLAVLSDMEMEDCHRILFSCLRSVEVSMEDQGMKVPKYTEHRVSQVKHDMNPDYTPCRRCRYSCDLQKDSSGYYSRCSLLKVSDGTDHMVNGDDGCSWGVLREEYLK